MVRKGGSDARATRQTGKHLPAFLLLLIAKSPAHGGALVAQLSELLPDWAIDSAGVYRVLRDLEDRGSVRSDWDVPDSGAARRVYRMTDAGKRELGTWREDVSARKRGLDLFLELFAEWKKADGS